MLKLSKLDVLILITAVTFTVTGAAQASATTDVMEIAGYQQIYQLNIPNNAAFDTNSVPYSVDNSGIPITAGINRIGYYLELDDGTGRQWVWASMEAFTQDLTKIGVPTLASGAVWQMTVNDMNVESNAAGITTGTGIITGNIEFWPYDYHFDAVIGGIGGSNNIYDFNDLNAQVENYGSMQIHNYGAGQTLLGYNDWGGNPALPIDDIGIGNNTIANSFDGLVHPDWTFSQNADSFTLKSLEVWVQPVPIPAAIWLFISSLLGLWGITRKRANLK